MNAIQLPLFFDKNMLYYSKRLGVAWIGHEFYQRNPHHWFYWKQYGQIEFLEEEIIRMEGYRNVLKIK